MGLLIGVCSDLLPSTKSNIALDARRRGESYLKNFSSQPEESSLEQALRRNNQNPWQLDVLTQSPQADSLFDPVK
jgi:hypothetical protein